jgi:hypothetical protein
MAEFSYEYVYGMTRFWQRPGLQEAIVKTAHRKELETNYLADQLNRLVEGRNPHAPVWLAILLVGGLVALGYWAISRQTQLRVSLAWQELARETGQRTDTPQLTAEDMKSLAERLRGTPVVLAARFAQACSELELALRQIHDRAAAEKHLELAEKLFRSLLAETALPSELRLRCQLGLAQLAEIRYWLDQAQLDPDKRKQRLQAVIASYQEALNTPGVELRLADGRMHPLLEYCQERIRRLQDDHVADLTLLRLSEFAPPPGPSASPSATPPR